MPNEIYHRSNFGNPNAEGFGDVYYDHAATNKLYNHSDYYENSDGTDATLKDLNNKASIVLTPTAYSDGSLNTVIPPYQVLPTELVTNGDFSDGSTGWTHNNLSGTSTFSVSNNELTFSRDTFGDSFYQTDVAPAVAGVYLLTFNITAISGGSLRYSFSPNSAANTSNRVSANSVGSYSTSFVSDGTLLDFVFDLDSNGASVTIDNVSVKKVQEADFDFSRGSSATRVNEQGLVEDVQILSGELVQNGNFEQIGAEEVTNGNFETDSDWIKQTGWTISDGKAIATSTNGSLYQANDFVSGKIYRIRFEITSYESGGLICRFNNDETNIFNSVGTHTLYFKSDNSFDYVYFLGNNSFTGSIDNVSVKEVGQNWLFQNGWNMGDGVAVYSGTVSAYRTIYQEDALTVSSKYRLTFDIVSISSGSIENISQSSPTSYSTVGTKTEDFIATSTDLFLKPTTDADLTIDNVSIKEVTDDTDLPRIDFTDGTGSLLLEPQRTNLFQYSEDFSTWQVLTNAVVTDNFTTSPDGTQNASKFTFDGTTNGRIEKPVPTTIGNQYTFSIWLKNDNLADPTQVWIGNSQFVQGEYVTITNEWQRFTTTQTADGSTEYPRVNVNQVGNIFAWGAQFEEGSYATSYIPTSGSTVTRSADVANNSGNADLFNDSEGVLYAEVSALSSGTGYRVISISDGSTSNVLRFYYSPTSNRIGANLRSNSADVFSIANLAISNDLDFIKIAISYKLNDFKIYIDGTQVQSYTSGNVPIGINELALDNGAGNDKFEGNVKCVAVFKEALNNDLLERLTGEGYESFRLLAEANNYTII